MDSFGFEDIVNDFNRFEQNADQAQPEVKKYAIKMRDQARSIAKSKGLAKTGAGVSGIDIEEKVNEIIVGWGQRPNFHLYFHELGFHALDNRRGKIRVRRNNKNRSRIYNSVKATYVSPKPHMRPAFDQLEPEFYNTIQNTLEKGV